ncbi:hypothetical protein AB6Q56_17705 [Dechloromonas sp. ARDL1]|uniref:hypothetical protein n=1 Tax=Dechloromonas sp. ARDL1 TaxID=3322121 RepID=UPI003DA740EC
MFASKTTLAMCAVLGLLVAMPAVASDAKKADPNKEQVKRLQQAQRKLEQEKTQLAQEKASVEAERDVARKKAEGEAQRVAALGRELGSLRKAKEDLAARLAQVEVELKQAREQIANLEGEGRRLQATLGGEKQQHAACVARNQEMHKTGLDILARYQTKGCSDSVLQAEPFTGLKRVEIENTAEDMKERLDSQKIGS